MTQPVTCGHSPGPYRPENRRLPNPSARDRESRNSLPPGVSFGPTNIPNLAGYGPYVMSARRQDTVRYLREYRGSTETAERQIDRCVRSP
jgi:hypothetical protein